MRFPNVFLVARFFFGCLAFRIVWIMGMIVLVVMEMEIVGDLLGDGGGANDWMDSI